MAKNKLTFMNSLRHYTVTNGICELDLEDVYNMVYRNIYYGVFLKIVNNLRPMTFDDGSGTTILSPLELHANAIRYIEENNITYRFKDNVHHIEVKEFPCDIIHRGTQTLYLMDWIKLAKIYMDCSFSFNNNLYPLDFSYKAYYIETQDFSINDVNFKNLSMILLQSDFQEDISMLVTKSIPKSNAYIKKNVFTSLKFVQRISEEIPAGTCSYIVAPVKKYDDKDYSMPYMEAFNKTVDSLKSNYVINSQRSRSCAVDSYTVSDTFKEWFAHELATNPDFQGNPLQ